MAGRANKPTDVFAHINMCDGDREKCWPWLGKLDKGRPYFRVSGKKMLAYRVAYECVHGPIPEGMLLRHRCDNGWCCNPFHTEPGSHEENMQDMRDRERHGMTHHAVRYIRKLLDKGEQTHQQIADLYGCSRETITAIANGKRKGSVTDDK